MLDYRTAVRTGLKISTPEGLMTPTQLWSAKDTTVYDTLISLANRLDEFIQNSDESSYTPICDYKVCQKCEMNCFYRQEIPKIETKFLKLNF